MMFSNSFIFVTLVLVGEIFCVPSCYYSAYDDPVPHVNRPCPEVKKVDVVKDAPSLDPSVYPHPRVLEVLEHIHKRCIANLSNEAEESDTFRGAEHALQECIESLFIGTELENFQCEKLCEKRDDSLSCLDDYRGKMEQCLPNQDYSAEFLIVRNILKSIFDGACGNDYLLSQYIVNKGHKCLIEKNDGVDQCFRHHGSDITKVGFEEQCENIAALQQCIVDELKTCSETEDAAKLFESFCNVMEKEVPCKMDTGKGVIMNSVNGNTKLVLLRDVLSLTTMNRSHCFFPL